jgi:hypothetical protein
LTNLVCTGDDNSSVDPATGIATLDVDAGETIVCTYTNTQDATVRITKNAVPDSGQDFAYTTSGTGAAAFTGGFSLDDDADATLPSTRLFTFTGSQLGAKTVTETLPVTGWSLTNLVCTGDDNSSVDPATGIATLDVDAGETIVCTYTNTQRPTIIVRKITTGVAGGPFDFTTTGGNGFTTPFTITTVTPGVAVAQTFPIAIAGVGQTYTVTEGLEAGFVLTDVSCTVTVAGVAGTTASGVLATRTGTITNLTAGTTVTCTFINSGALTTRTQGFWATHLSITELVWEATGTTTVGGITFDGMNDADRTICDYAPLGVYGGTDVGPLAIEQVMGGFWSSIAKTTTGDPRIALDKARMQLLQQLLAAILNNQLFGSVPSAVSIDQAKAAYCGTDITAIRAAMSAMAAFNESGDSGLFTPGASADPKGAKAIADKVYWDVLP